MKTRMAVLIFLIIASVSMAAAAHRMLYNPAAAADSIVQVRNLLEKYFK